MDQTYNNLKKYKFAKEYDLTASIDHSLIYSILNKAWEVTPSKNNFMPYKVHVLGPDKKNLKELVYKKCLENEYRIDKIDPEIRYQNFKPNIYNIVSCSFLLIFTYRHETALTEYKKISIEKGTNFESFTSSKSSLSNARIEIGMFCSVVSGMCLENNIDIGHVGCVPSEIEYWNDEEFQFIDQPVILLMTIGKGKIYRQHTIRKNIDLKPDFKTVINFID